MNVRRCTLRTEKPGAVKRAHCALAQIGVFAGAGARASACERECM